MSAKGGKKSTTKAASKIDAASRVTAISGAWAFIIAAAVVVGLGSFVAGYYTGSNGNVGFFNGRSDEVLDMNYKSAGIAYTYNRANQNEDVDSQLLNEFNGTHGNYVVISSKERYDALVKLAKDHSMTDSDLIDYSLNDDFFKSGSVVAISAETLDLSTTGIKRVYRDDKYNVTIEVDKTEPQAGITSDSYIYGQVYFVKIENVTPKSVQLVELDAEE